MSNQKPCGVVTPPLETLDGQHDVTPMTRKHIAIIGAGMSGLTCADILKQAGLEPVVYDKGRGIGGRLATRRTDTSLQFDHGAQYISAKTPEFKAFLEDVSETGWASTWDIGGHDRYVGIPGMNGLAKYLSQNLQVQQNVEIDAVEELPTGCAIKFGDETHEFDTVISTVPPIQAAQLVGPEHHFSNQLAGVQMEPC